MIIWGWRTRSSVADRGEFHCPHCSAKRPYKHEKLRNWFTLYFIPVIPLQHHGEFITCEQCTKSWDPAVLGHNPEKQEVDQLDEIARDWLRTMSLIGAIAGQPTEKIADTIVADIQRTTGRQYQPADVFQTLKAVPASQVTQQAILYRLGCLPTALNALGKEHFLTSALTVLRMATNCSPAEVALVRGIGSELRISEAHIKGILFEAGLQ